MSIDILINKIKQKQNPSVIGLDTKLEYVPEYIKSENYKIYGQNLEAAANAILVFNKGIIDKTYDIVPAVKLQSAYYEMYGYNGIWCLYETIKYAKEKGMYVITDVKKNDIGSTAEAYANAYLGEVDVDNNKVKPFNSDGLTINPYLGSDGINPFIDKCNKFNRSIFVLVKTSNKSSSELQDLICNDKQLYKYTAELVNRLGKTSMGANGYSNVGAVVGATFPEQAKEIRKIMPDTFFLVPGYGAQGASGKEVSVSFNMDGLGAIVNSSRGIICAYLKQNKDEKYYDITARQAALEMKDEILSYI